MTAVLINMNVNMLPLQKMYHLWIIMIQQGQLYSMSLTIRVRLSQEPVFTLVSFTEGDISPFASKVSSYSLAGTKLNF
jgi:hypothetical protein